MEHMAINDGADKQMMNRVRDHMRGRWVMEWDEYPLGRILESWGKTLRALTRYISLHRGSVDTWLVYLLGRNEIHSSDLMEKRWTHNSPRVTSNWLHGWFNRPLEKDIYLMGMKIDSLYALMVRVECKCEIRDDTLYKETLSPTIASFSLIIWVWVEQLFLSAWIDDGITGRETFRRWHDLVEEGGQFSI